MVGRSADQATADAVATVARESASRLVAYLASITGDLAAAEDALSEAMVSALTTWGRRGIPDRPASWLLTASRRNLIDGARRRAVATRAMPEIVRALQERDVAGTDEIPDRRLHLMFACAHPAIDRSMHAPLILQAVLGISADHIGEAFLVNGTTMGQRLVRAKSKIKTAGIPFSLPPLTSFADRLDSVLEAVHAAYGLGWDDLDGADPGRGSLTAEALRLSRLLVELLPEEPETHGLLALHLGIEARRFARVDRDGMFIPLASQDMSRWSTDLIQEAEAELVTARGLRRLGPFQLHAAIQSVHNQRAITGVTNIRAIATLYDGLYALHPSVGVQVARAAAYRESAGPINALELLSSIDPATVQSYQPFWVVKSHCLRDVGDTARAAQAADVAIALTASQSVRQYLAQRFR